MNIQPSWWEQFSDEQIRSTYDFSTEDGFPGYFGSGYVSRLIAAHPEHPIVIDDQLFDIILDHLIRNPDYRDDEMRLLIGQMRVKDLLELAPEESESAPLFVHGLMCGRMAIVKSFMEVFLWLVTQLYPDAIAIACLGDPKFPTDNLILLEYLLSRSELDPNQKLVFFAPTVEFYELKPIEIASIVSNPRYVIALLSDSRLNITDVDAYVIFNGIGNPDDMTRYYDKMVSLTLDKLLMFQEHL